MRTSLLLTLSLIALINSSNGDIDIIAKVMQQIYKGCTAVILQENQGRLTTVDIRRERLLTPPLNLVLPLTQLSTDKILLESDIDRPTMEVILNSLRKQKKCYLLLLSGSVKHINKQIEKIRSSTIIFGRLYFVIIAEDSDPDLNRKSVEEVFSIDNGVVINRHVKNDVMTVYDVKLRMYTKRQVLKDVKDLQDRPSQLPDLKGKLLKSGVLAWSPFAIKSNDSLRYKGMDIEVIKAISQKLNFKFTFVEPADGKWGYLNNGTWTGMIGQVVNGETNMSTSGIGISEGRETGVDFSKEISYGGEIFIVPAPAPLPQWQSLIRPFDFPTWILILLSLVVVAIVFSATTAVYLKETSAAHPVFLPMRAFFISVRVICSETIGHLPRDSPSRMVLGIWFLTATVILACYAGLITSILVNPLKYKHISTLDGLAFQDQVKWGGVDYGGMTEAVLKSYRTPAYKKLWENMIFVKNTDECVKRTFIENFACLDSFLAMIPVYNEAMKTYKSSTALFRTEYLFTTSSAIPLPEGSSLKEYFDQVILRLHEAGIVMKWLDDYEGVPRTWKAFGAVDLTKLTLNHLTGAFYLLLLGALFALLVFIFNVAIDGNKSRTPGK